MLADDSGGRIAIQAKRHKNDVGVSAVQEIWAGMAHYGCESGVLAVASRLTPQASQLLKSVKNVSVMTAKHIADAAGQVLRDVLVLELEPGAPNGSASGETE